MAKNESKVETKSSRGQIEKMPSRRSSFLSPSDEMYEPMRIFEELLRPSRFIEDFFRGSSNWRENQVMTPSVDVEESETEYLVSADLPGFNKEDIKIECTDNQLTISAERSEEETKRRSSRRSYSSFYKSFSLPQGVTSEQITADYENGVLTVHVPRGEESRPRRIEIGASNSGRQAQAGSKEAEVRPH